MKNFETLREELVFKFKSLEMTARREIKEGFHLDVTNCDLYDYRLRSLEKEIYYESISDEDYAELDKLKAMRLSLTEILEPIVREQLKAQ